MKNTFLKKIIAGVMLTAFCFSNSLIPAVSAMEELFPLDMIDIPYNTNTTDDTDSDVKTLKPELREEGIETFLKLKGEISITDKQDTINLSLRDSDVKQVLRLFADKAELNIIFYNSVEGTITLDLVDVPLNKAFEMVMETTGLTYAKEGNTIIVASTEDENFVSIRQELNVIPVKYIDATAMAYFLNKNIYTLKRPGFSGSEIAVTNPANNELLILGSKNDASLARKIVDKFDVKPTITTFTVKHVTPAEMADAVCNQLLKATLNTEGESDVEDVLETGEDSDIIDEADEEPLTLGAGVVACTAATKMDDETDFVSFPLQNLSVSYYTQLGKVKVIGGSEHMIELIREFIEETDQKQPMAYLEMSIIELSEAGSREFQNTWSFWSKHFSANFTGTNFQTNSTRPIFFVGDSSPDAEGVSKYSGSATLMYTINYLIENRKGRVVANPRILITNGQESVIDLTSDYVKTVTSQILTTTGSGSSGTQRDYEIGDDNGIKITVTPFISPDGYVTLNIEPEYATIASQVYTTNETTGSDDLAATLLQRRNLTLNNIRIKDGETLIIGGMIKEEETKNVNKVPFLGDIPIIGTFFRSTTNSKTKEEMVILLTPKIVIDTEDAVIKDEETL